MVEIARLTVSAADLALGTAPVHGMVRGQPVVMRPAASLTRWSLRAAERETLGTALSRDLPAMIGTHHDGIARIGPDEWFALMPPGTPPPVVPSAMPYSLVDVSARSIGLVVEGAGAVAALSRGCPLDLDRFTPGRATRTVFETVEIQIWMMAPDRFHVEVWRSFAPWLWHAIADGFDPA